jgi:hypothetical protein
MSMLRMWIRGFREVECAAERGKPKTDSMCDITKKILISLFAAILTIGATPAWFKAPLII